MSGRGREAIVLDPRQPILSRPTVVWLLAAVLYLAASLLAMARVLPDAGNLLMGLAKTSSVRFLDRTDQQMVLTTVIGNARRLIERPALLRDEGQCFPMPRAYALGEHMFGEGLLAAPVFALTDEPILAYNSMLVLRLWIAAMAMFAYLFYVTGSPGAAFLGGLLFGLNPYRLADPVHPFVHGDMWVPLALLFLHRLYEGAGWLTAVGLGLALSLTILESIYPLLAAAIVLSVYAIVLAMHRPSRLPHVVPRVGLALAVSIPVAWYVLGPYLTMSETWGVLTGVRPMSGLLHDFVPGGDYFPGALLLVLAAVGLADRLRGARATAAGDPRGALFLAGFFCLWSSVYGLPLPGTDFWLPSPLRMLIGTVPGLDAARAMVLVKIGVVLALAALAGYGTWALIERRRASGRLALVGLLSTLFLGEIFVPFVADRFYGHRPPFEAYPVALVGVYRDFVETLEPPVLDVPMEPDNLFLQAHYLHWAVYHGGATAACYNSFVSPVQRALAEIADRWPDPRAARALSALGVKTVVVHDEGFGSEAAGEASGPLFAPLPPDVTKIADQGTHAVFRLAPSETITSSFDALVDGGHDLPEVGVAGPEAEIPFVFEARPGAIYRHPEPIEPSALRVQWRGTGGAPTVTQHVRRLLPLAIVGGDRSARVLSLPVAVPPGDYTVRLTRTAEPERLLSARRVRVLAPDAA